MISLDLGLPTHPRVLQEGIMSHLCLFHLRQFKINLPDKLSSFTCVL